MRAIDARDAGLALISRINRWLIAGAVALSGCVSVVAAHAFHGTLGSTHGARRRQAARRIGPSQPPASDDGAGNSSLQQPATAPSQPAPAPAPVVSGGS